MVKEIIEVTQQLLDAIARRDWEKYESLCDPSLTCFEPEASGHLVTGLQFHRFYFEDSGTNSAKQETICRPIVRELGPDCALITYSRLSQSKQNGEHSTKSFAETRVWRRTNDGWKLVHLHRSAS